MMGNGKGYCANSRSRPLICPGASGQTCLLCGRLKGGPNGCWARGCQAPTSEAELHNRSSNIRPRAREKAREHEAELGRQLAAERRAWEAAAMAAGKGRSCLKATDRPRTAKQVSWSLGPGPLGAKKPLTQKRLQPDAKRQRLFWDNPGATAECDGCGRRCDDPNRCLTPEEGRSRFALSEVLCPECAKDQVGAAPEREVIFFLQNESINPREVDPHPNVCLRMYRAPRTGRGGASRPSSPRRRGAQAQK